ncbi:hypothetical protein GGR09_001630 [Bartonella heixiaziensis]
MNNIAKFAARCYFPHRDAWQKRVSILGGRARGMPYSMLVL